MIITREDSTPQNRACTCKQFIHLAGEPNARRPYFYFMEEKAYEENPNGGKCITNLNDTLYEA